MVFSSITFLFFFLPIVLAIYYIVPFQAKNLILLLASIVFYAWGEPMYVILLILSILLNYFCGLEIGARVETEEKHSDRAKRSLIVALVANLLILGFFKYYGFLIDTLNGWFPLKLTYRELPLPVGISFYTFQAISYLIDVYRKKTRSQKSLIRFALYITMFPQLIAGPIVRYVDVERQLANRKIGVSKLGSGAMSFLIGLGKKTILANACGAAFESVSSLPASNLSVLTAWLGCFLFAFQIYFDFSGYSDMAIGLGRMFGFEFQKNFDYPYLSESVSEFWRRWHISLGDWFREYVYIPLGGNRCSVSRNIVNLLIVWGLTGMWHGAAWNFIAWGVYYGILLVFEKYVWGVVVDSWPKILRRIYAMVLVLIGWVFFFSPSLGAALRYLSAMFGMGAGFSDARGVFLLYTNWLVLILSFIGCTKIGNTLLQGVPRLFPKEKLRIAVTVIIYFGIFLISVAFLISDSFNPFLYFRF